MSILETRDLVKHYGKDESMVKAVDGVSFSIEEKELIAVVGRSGSGKTTLMQLLGGLDRPDAGSIRIGGQELTELNRDDLTVFRRKRIGFIFQNYNLLPVLSAAENILLPLGLDGQDMDRGFFDEVVALLGIEKKLSALPTHLSGGEQQRVAIARALLTKPALILADEPTGNLDSKTGDDVLSLLTLSGKRFGQTIVIVTHNDAVAGKTDRVLSMEDGKLA